MVIKINSSNTKYVENELISNYDYQSVIAEKDEEGNVTLTPKTQNFTFKTDLKVPKVGVLLVGFGGNNGTTMLGGIHANKLKKEWYSKRGLRKANYYGSITQASTVNVGTDLKTGEEIYVPMNQLLPMVHPEDMEIHGWDISKMSIGHAIERAGVFPNSLQEILKPELESIVPWPAIYMKHFIASNQEDRADNVIKGTVQEQLETIRKNIRDFKKERNCDKIIVLWTANTERYAEVNAHNSTAAHLLETIKNYEKIEAETGAKPEIAPSQIYAVASILEGCSYINGSPQNTLVPGVVELAKQQKVFVAGDDFKSGQTKLKSVLADFLISAGLKTTAIVSYNHLGNNDGKNLSAPEQFRSKEISKSNVVDDMIKSNDILYDQKAHEKPDHVVVIKYVPAVGDSKRALDEYTSQIFMGGSNTIVIHNTCEDSLLAAPLMIDLVVLTELMERITYKIEGADKFKHFHSVLSILSYLLKAPRVPEHTPVVNALFRQRYCIENCLRAFLGLPPQSHMLLEYKAL